MKVSLIVPVGRPDTASLTIESILGQSLLPEDIEIICVGASLSSLADRFDDPRIHYVPLEHRCNPAQTRMAGIVQATGDIYLFVDDDIELDSHLLERLLCVFSLTPNLGAVGARLPCTEKTYFSRVTDLANFWSQQSLQSGTRSWLYSAVLAVPAIVYNEVGGFNADLAVGEDVDLTSRINQAHYSVRYEAGLIGYHNHRRTTLRAASSYFWSNGRLANLYFHSNPQLRCFRVVIVVQNVLQWLYNTICCNRKNILSLLLYLPGIIVMYSILSVSLEYHYQKLVRSYIKEKITAENLSSHDIRDSFLLRALRGKTSGNKVWSFIPLSVCNLRDLVYTLPIILLLLFYFLRA
ncbi:MAG: glycosyltransferase [Proteobacteria bacterium]|jgi:GT2 family glycosyltransferase|nr:glycosyltransferase [Desulfocapsa sp.]MBU3943089.1 glycosyltransferase [Pseudomonadota bacterium]MBU3983935.1 glycosyltransferase [Pseudomonadota bacterium]MBU4042115.1 glycosyltransferase [Pseudomonadota bacterium]MBU4168988.1 glycosyltransferase [Pseudomonadota bacterium]